MSILTVSETSKVLLPSALWKNIPALLCSAGMVFFTMDNVIIFLTAIHVGFFKTGEVHQDLQRQWTVLHHVIYCLTGYHQGIAFAPHIKQEILLGLVQTGENIAIQGREISTSVFSLNQLVSFATMAYGRHILWS